jgi:short-subunit dehydrogenase
MDLNGRTVVLTGASRGIGALLAVRLAEERPHLVLAARDASRLQTVASQCATRGARVTIVATDVSQADDRQRLVQTAGDVDVLINNAGVETATALVDQIRERVEAQLATNLLGPIELTRLVLPGMIARRRGSVVNVSSMSGKAPTPFNSVYSATKFGLNGFTASLRFELEGTGVHAGAVCPGFVAETGMWADTGVRAPPLMREVPPEKVIAAVLKVIAGAGEVLVTPGPIRPLLALREIFPGMDGPVLRAIGLMEAFRRRAAKASHPRMHTGPDGSR